MSLPVWHRLYSERPLDEENDCTVCALAGATDMPYAEAHRILKDAGRRDGRRFKFLLYMSCQGPSPEIGGWTFTQLRDVPYITINRFLKDFPKGRFIVRRRGHVCAVIDGKVVSEPYPRLRCKVTRIWWVHQ